MKFETPTTAEIDARSEALSKEVWDHIAQIQKEHPEYTDQHRLFEGWALQKIASLQLMVEQLWGKEYTRSMTQK